MITTQALRAVISRSGQSARSVSVSMGRAANYCTSAIGQAERMGAAINTDTVAAIGAACGHTLALVPCDDLPPSSITIEPRPTE